MKKLLILLSLCLPVNAHEWYDPSCCSGQDCRPIPCQEVIKVPGGFKYHSIFFNQDKVKASQDQQCHACFYGNDPNQEAIVGHCLYLPGST